jgi:hypothetical protein
MRVRPGGDEQLVAELVRRDAEERGNLILPDAAAAKLYATEMRAGWSTTACRSAARRVTRKLPHPWLRLRRGRMATENSRSRALKASGRSSIA